MGLAKRGPKPKGQGKHNEVIEDWGKELQAGGSTIIAGGGVEREKVVPTPGGNKDTRRPDVIWEDPQGQLHYGNVGKTTADGKTPVPREQKAKADLESTGTPTEFRAYDCPKKPKAPKKT